MKLQGCCISEIQLTLGSVLNHDATPTIIGLEPEQFEMIGDYPDVLIGCVGGGSNFAGLSFPFIRDKIYDKKIEIIAVEPTACPTVTRGPFAYDFGDTAAKTPLLPMFTLGHNFLPKPIHAGGLRYHGMAPLVSQLIVDGLVQTRSYNQLQTYEAGIIFARTEGMICAPESNHAIAAAIEEARKAKEEGNPKTILFNLSGHGLLDLPGYDAFLDGKLTDYTLPQEELEISIKVLESLPKLR